MTQSNNTQKKLKPKNQKKYTEAVNLGKKLSKTPDITKVSVATQMFELIHDEDREIISKAFMEGANLTEKGLMTYFYFQGTFRSIITLERDRQLTKS